MKEGWKKKRRKEGGKEGEKGEKEDAGKALVGKKN